MSAVRSIAPTLTRKVQTGSFLVRKPLKEFVKANSFRLRHIRFPCLWHYTSQKEAAS